MSRIDESRAFVPLNVAVLTVSDTRTQADDRSGDALAERLTGAGHAVAARRIVRDDRAAIAAALREWCGDPAVDVVISTGGTGLTGRDVTIEAHRDVYEKEIDAFGPLFAHLSVAKIGTSAVQSRGSKSATHSTATVFTPSGRTGAPK